MGDITMRNHKPQGPIFYITAVVYGRFALFTQPSYIIPLYDSLHYYCRHYCCRHYCCGLIGYVFMPDHIHLLLWPEDAHAVEGFMRDYKTFTAKRIVRQATAEGNHSLLAHCCAAGCETGRSEHKVWQDSFWEFDLYSERFIRQKLNYMHRNPVRAALV